MGLKIWQKKEEKNIIIPNILDYPKFVEPFYILSITLLSLLLPLSFLLLARLSSAQYILSLTTITTPNSFLFSIFLHTNPNLLHALILLISLTSFIHALTGKNSLITEFPTPVFRPRVHVAWIFLCTLQVCVGLGIEATIKAGVDGVGFDDGKSIFSKLIFFVGLHETMAHWAKTIVRPIVDDTMFGGPREVRWQERWALGWCFGAVSWWRLKDEVESLVVIVEVKRDMMIKVGLGDFIGLWLYYLTVVIGMTRIIKGVMWCYMKLFCRKLVDDDQEFEHELFEDKV